MIKFCFFCWKNENDQKKCKKNRILIFWTLFNYNANATPAAKWPAVRWWVEWECFCACFCDLHNNLSAWTACDDQLAFWCEGNACGEAIVGPELRCISHECPDNDGVIAFDGNDMVVIWWERDIEDILVVAKQELFFRVRRVLKDRMYHPRSMWGGWMHLLSVRRQRGSGCGGLRGVRIVEAMSLVCGWASIRVLYYPSMVGCGQQMLRVVWCACFRPVVFVFFWENDQRFCKIWIKKN